MLTGHLFEVLLRVLGVFDRAVARGFLFSFLAWVCHLARWLCRVITSIIFNKWNRGADGVAVQPRNERGNKELQACLLTCPLVQFLIVANTPEIIYSLRPVHRVRDRRRDGGPPPVSQPSLPSPFAFLLICSSWPPSTPAASVLCDV
jgi:hypothetical protein